MDNFHVLEVRGEIDFSQKRRIERELEQIEGFGPDAVTILDLARVGYLDTTFINALLRERSRLAQRAPRSSIRLAAPRSAMVWRIFDISGLHRAFALFTDVDSARSGTAVA
jgi:anti-anti-sigma factor